MWGTVLLVLLFILMVKYLLVVMMGLFRYLVRMYFSATTGQYIGQLGSNGNGNGQFSSPHGIAIDDEGYIFVSVYNSGTSYLHILSPDRKQVKLISGLSSPWGVALDKDGYIYVADYGNKRITKY
uniref:SMP-30/Gluconolactonase/LRE-like region domain-containing protein n=1 Tax=Amphimedon queenslandica TaxID=400682 RepID=A0A1X7T9S4_AMPQE